MEKILRFWEIDNLSYKEGKSYCKNCQHQVKFEDCSHLLCKDSYVKGFCSYSCERAYNDVKEYELSRYA